MSVCGCNSSSPLSQFIDFAEHAAEKIGDGLLNAGFGAVEHGIEAAEHGLQFAEHAGDLLMDKGECALKWAEHMGRPLFDVGCEVAAKVEQLGEHLGETFRRDAEHLGEKAPILAQIGQYVGQIEAKREADNARAVEGLQEGLEMLIAGAIDGRLWEDTSADHVDPRDGQWRQAGDQYGLG